MDILLRSSGFPSAHGITGAFDAGLNRSDSNLILTIGDSPPVVKYRQWRITDLSPGKVQQSEGQSPQHILYIGDEDFR
jgi:hypothetical protein